MWSCRAARPGAREVLLVQGWGFHLPRVAAPPVPAWGRGGVGRGGFLRGAPPPGTPPLGTALSPGSQVGLWKVKAAGV